jgi:23S rRNA U2552 (ribose-2'-O)-methylase RlmE/FtsJ
MRTFGTRLAVGCCVALSGAWGSVPADAFSLGAVTGTHVAPLEMSPKVQTISSLIPQDPVLKDIRRRLVNKRRVTFSELRRLADTGDGLASYRLAERIVGLDRPDLLGDAAHYFSIAVFDGRTYAVNPLSAILSNPQVKIKDSRLKHIERALLRQARSGQIRAIEALVKLYKSGTPFGAKPEEALALMRSVLEQKHDSEIALQLAVNIARNAPLAPDEIEEIRRYLQIAETSDVLGTRAAAENLLRNFPEPSRTNEAG